MLFPASLQHVRKNNFFNAFIRRTNKPNGVKKMYKMPYALCVWSKHYDQEKYGNDDNDKTPNTTDTRIIATNLLRLGLSFSSSLGFSSLLLGLGSRLLGLLLLADLIGSLLLLLLLLLQLLLDTANGRIAVNGLGSTKGAGLGSGGGGSSGGGGLSATGLQLQLFAGGRS